MPAETVLGDEARISIVGGGPGGLFLATVLRKARPAWTVSVYERNPRGATYGFGVVFTARTVRGLHDADPEVTDAITTAFESWTDIEVGLPGGTTRSAGHDFSALERRRLLQILGQHAEAAGVETHFEVEIEDLDQLRAESDLLVGADGANSRVRDRWRDELRPSIHEGSSIFAWFATPRRYDALTFHFVDTPHGAFATHAYPFSPDLSTFIVETDEASWRRAGLDVREHDPPPPGESDRFGLAFCQEIFAESLQGHPLIGNNSRWGRFPTIRNERWRAAGNVVLLGDAAHTAHFSVGSGTKMAMEDAAALAAALTAEDRLDSALAAYQETRQPQVQRLQDLAEPSRGWWESFGSWVDRDTSTFAINFLTRTGGELLDSLAKRDNAFAAAHTRPAVLTDRVMLADHELPNRIAVIADQSLLDDAMTDSVSSAAGLVIVAAEIAATCGDRWPVAVAALRERGARVAVVDDEPASTEADVVVSSIRGGAQPPSDRPWMAVLHAPPDVADHDAHHACVGRARAAEAAGACALWLVPASYPEDDSVGRDGLITASNRVRTAVSVPLVVSGMRSTLDAATFASAGRADICVGRPGDLDLTWNG